MKHLLKIMALIIVMFTMITCSEKQNDPIDNEDDSPTLKSTVTNPGMCKSNTYTLLAGQNIDAGTVIIENDASNLYITVCSYEGFQNVEENIKILIGEATALTFTKRPVPGHFPYKYTVGAGIECFSITPIPLSTITGKTNCVEDRIEIIVHADVIANGKAETAFTGAKTGAGNAWWYYISYRILCCAIS